MTATIGKSGIPAGSPIAGPSGQIAQPWLNLVQYLYAGAYGQPVAAGTGAGSAPAGSALAVAQAALAAATRAGGQITVPANAASVTQAHGLNGTPSRIMLSPAGAGLGAGYYPQNLTATSFDVIFPNPSTFATYLFWEAAL